MVQFGYSYFLSSLFFGRKIMAVMQIDISSWCCQYGMPGHHQISQITKLHLVFVWRTWCFCFHSTWCFCFHSTWCFCFHSTWCFCFHSTWCFCLTTLGADAFNASKHFETVFWQDFLVQRKDFAICKWMSLWLMLCQKTILQMRLLKVLWFPWIFQSPSMVARLWQSHPTLLWRTVVLNVLIGPPHCHVCKAFFVALSFANLWFWTVSSD